jgi:hypothetical protein
VHVRRVLLDSFADVGGLGGTFPALAALEVEDARFDAADLRHVAALRHLRSLKLLARPRRPPAAPWAKFRLRCAPRSKDAEVPVSWGASAATGMQL